MMRRLIYTERRQVCELQTDTNSTQRQNLQSAPAIPGAKEGGHRRLTKRERKAPQAKPPAGRGFEGRAPNYNSKRNLDEYFHVTRAHFQALYAQQTRGRW